VNSTRLSRALDGVVYEAGKQTSRYNHHDGNCTIGLPVNDCRQQECIQ